MDQVKAQLKKCDKAGTGRIPVSSLSDLIEKLCGDKVSKEMREALFRSFHGGDPGGSIPYDEFIDWLVESIESGDGAGLPETFEDSPYGMKYTKDKACKTPGEFWMAVTLYLAAMYVELGMTMLKATAAANEFKTRIENDVNKKSQAGVKDPTVLQNLLGSAAWVAARAWTSTERCLIFNMEWCGVLQAGLRIARDDLADRLVPIFGTMNLYSVSNRLDSASLGRIEWPTTTNPSTLEEEWILHRGGRLPAKFLQWYKDAVKDNLIYRVSMALPTSKLGELAMTFMTSHSYPKTDPMLYTRFHLSPVLKCVHINCSEPVTLVPQEQEFCFPPYSAFRAMSLDQKVELGMTYWQLDVEVLPDNLSEAMQGPVPVRAPCAPWA